MIFKYINKAASLLAAIVLGFTAVSCADKSDTEPGQDEYTISSYRKEFVFTFREGVMKSTVTTNAPVWSVKTSYTWINVSSIENESGERVIEVKVSENGSSDQRVGHFDLIGSDENGKELVRTSVIVTQNPKRGVVDGAILFDDSTFENYILDDFDQNSDGAITEEEAARIITLDLENTGINSVGGVRYFPNLDHLDVSDNNVKYIDVSGLQKLASLFFNMNKVSSLKVENCSALQSIMGRTNKLQSVDFSTIADHLKVLDLSQNVLTSANLSGMTSLEYAALGKNNIVSLDLTGCSKVSILSIPSNQISELDLSDLAELLTLDCSENNLQSLDLTSCTKLGLLNVNKNSRLNQLDLSKSPIVDLDICGTKIASLNISKPSDVATLKMSNTLFETFDFAAYSGLTILHCSDMKNLASGNIDLKANILLQEFVCKNSNITAVDFSNAKELVEVDLQNNKLTSLDLSNSKKLTSVKVSGNSDLTTLYISKDLKGSSTLKIEKGQTCTVIYK